MTEKLIAGVILIAIGLLFFFNNKNMGRGCADFYKKLYTKKNMTIMFRAAGILLIIAGIIFLLFR
jgi:hypothetical protein